VSLPYVDWAGVIADDPQIASALIDRAVELADELDVRYLELRHQFEFDHKLLTHKLTTKVQMRLSLPSSPDEVWKGLRSVVRTQVRKATKKRLVLKWGGLDLVNEFYDVFSRNMRDLGTPTYPRCLFHTILSELPEQAELCVARLDGHAIASCLAVHGQGLTVVPSASSLHAYRGTAANSLIYWRAIERAIARGQSIFDFGRSTIEGPTFTFKKKWGAQPVPVVWQYYIRKGHAQDMRPGNPKFRLAIGIWKRLPLALTRVLGPIIVRGIP
jgi:FemAB-related protein (PEP-CTERM system-associated)